MKAFWSEQGHGDGNVLSMFRDHMNLLLLP